MGINMVIPSDLISLLPSPRHIRPSLPNPPSQSPPSNLLRPNPSPPQPHHGPNLPNHLRWNPPLRRLRDPRNPMVLAPF
ncbi:hypothetical protein LINGRAPRIM_LOCUS918 [Linum grandiflorum]